MDRTNETATGYSYGGQQYQKQTKTDSQGNTYTVDIPMSNAIPVSSVTTPITPFNIPNPKQPVDYNKMTTGVTSPYLEQLQLQQQQDLNNQNKQLTDISSLQNFLSGKGEFQAQQSQAQGLSQAQADIIQKNAEMAALSKQAAAAQQENISQGRQLGSVASFVAGQGNEIERNRAIRALNIGAELDALQGNLQVAQMKVQQAVDAKYASVEQDLKNRLQMFDLNSKIMENRSQAEQKAWDRARYTVEQEQKRIDEKKKAETDIQNMIIEATPNAPKNIISNAKKLAESGASKLAVAQALGVYGGDYLGNEVKKAQLYKLGLENKKAIQEMYDKAGTGGLKTLSYEENAKFNSTPEVKNINAANAYARAISEYKSAINTYGTGEWFGKGSGSLGQAYSALVGATKDYYTLGTLDNGVQKLIALGIPEPSVSGLKSGRIDALDEALNQASQTLKANIDQLSSTAYKNTNEFKNLVDTSSGVLMSKMTNEELLNSMPGSSGSMGTNTSTNQTFFNK